MRGRRNKHVNHHKKHHHNKHRSKNPIKSLLIILCRILQGGFILYSGMTIISRIIAIVKYIQFQGAISTPVTQGLFMSAQLSIVAGYIWQILIALIIGVVAVIIIEFVIRLIKSWR